MAYSTTNQTAISVTNLGIRPDAITDNKIGLQSAINALYAKGAGTLFFPKGTYYWSGTVDVTGCDITFLGEEGSILLAAVDESAKKINISGAKRINFFNLTFNSNRSGSSNISNQYGFINTFNSEEIVIQNCSFFNTKNSNIYLGGGSRFITVDNCYFTGHFCGIYGYINSGESWTEKFLITNNSFDKTWVGPVGESACIKLQTNPNSFWTGFSKGHIISNNVINSTCQMGIELWSHGREMTVSNNTITNTDWGISLDNQEFCTVDGNIIKSVGYMGIECATICKDIVISNNAINGYTGYLTSGASRLTHYGLTNSNSTNERLVYNGNIIEGCTVGINWQTSVDCVYSNNILRDNGTNLFIQNGQRGQIYGNLFDTGQNITAYHVFFDASNSSLTGFHFAHNKFRGRTTDQSIFYYNAFLGQTGFGVYDICLENNTTDYTTQGGYGIFVGGQFAPTNYIYRNNFAPTGATIANSIPDASDSTSPYKTTDIENGYTYYGSYAWTIPASGITGDGIWVCVWSGGVGTQNNVRISARNNFNNEGNQYQAIELWATMAPYQGFYIGHSLYASPFYGINGITPYIQRAKTISNEVNAQNSIWLKISPFATGAAGQQFLFKYSQQNNLNTPYATYVEPTDTWNNANLYLDNSSSVNATRAYKFSDGILVGSTCSAGIYSPSSGKFDFLGALNSPFALNNANSNVSWGLKSGLAVSYYTGLGTTAYNPQNQNDFDSFLRTGVRFVSGGWIESLTGYSSIYDNYVAEFIGYFLATGDGNYQFGVNSDDAADIFIDGKKAADWYGGHGSGSGPGGNAYTIYLPQGLHRFWGRLQNGLGNSVIQALYKGPSETGYSVIPPNLLYSAPQDYIFRTTNSGANISYWGNVGVGTSSPTFSAAGAGLEVESNGQDAVIRCERSSGAVTEIRCSTAELTIACDPSNTVANSAISITIDGTERARITTTGINGTAIGATTPSTGAFTTLSVSGVVTLSAAAAAVNAGTTTGYGTYMNNNSQAGLVVFGATNGSYPNQCQLYASNSPIATISSTGLAVTGNFTLNKSGSDTIFQIQEGGVNTSQVESYLGDLYLTTQAAKNIILRTNSGSGGVATLSGTGLSVTGALSASGTTTLGLGGTASQNDVTIINGSSANLYGPQLRFYRNSVNKGSLGTHSGIVGDNSDALTLWVPVGSAIISNVGGTDVTTTSSTGLSITGALSASGATTDILSVSTSAAGRAAVIQNSGNYCLVDLRAGGTNQGAYLNFVPSGSSAGVIQLSGSDKLTITSAGLAVTGNITLGNRGYRLDFLNADCGIERPTATDDVSLNMAGAFRVKYGAYGASVDKFMVHGGGASVTGSLTISGSGTVDSNIYQASDSTTYGQYVGSGYIIAAQVGAATQLLNRNGSDGSIINFYRSGTSVGSISVTTTATAYNTSSDIRLKQNFRPITNSGEIIDSLKPWIFDWKTGERDSYGFAAQEVFKIFPQMVTKGDDEKIIKQQWAIDQSKLIPVLVAEIKALRERIAVLEKL